ncbi:MAG: YolD-like family protein [Erysipelotrichales bacterium]|nr:YolD-like family protein [Erysipelotrichales bacterium]
MHDRGMIKWAPFASVINGNEVLREIDEEKTRIEKPSLSSEQIEYLEYDLIESYNNSNIVEVIFYKQYHIYKIEGIITKIDGVTKKITINNNKTLLFSNILAIIKKNA